MSDASVCPKCGLPRRPGSLDCPACGIVFARFDPQRLSARRAARVREAGAEELNPYQAPAATVVDPLSRDDLFALPLASRGSRLVANILDSLSAFAAVFLGILPVSIATAASRDEEAPLAGCLLASLLLLALLAVNLYLLAKNGQTLGKKLLGIRIVRLGGEKASIWRLLFVRYLVQNGISAVPIVGPIFGLVDILFIFREDRRCLHDLAADTTVVLG